jgi:Asp/Glu/hydantoin racemase
LFNPNSSADATERMAAFARETLGDGWQVTAATNPDASPIIIDPAGLERATRSTLIAFEGGIAPHDGVIVSAFLDPGRAELAARLAVPVVGIAQAAMAEAAAHGRFAILSTTPELSAEMTKLIESYGHADACVGIVGISEDPHAVMGDPDRLVKALAELLDRAVGDLSAQAVIVGGGPLVDAARTLSGTAPVPLIEPIPAAARLIARLIARRIDLSSQEQIS